MMAGLSIVKKGFVPLLAALLLVTSFGAQPVKAEDESPAPQTTIYVVPAITDEKILPTTSISDDYISDEIFIKACPGEYEPASFVIRANEEIVSLEAEATELTGESGSIPSSNIDIRVVKCWYQAGVEFWDVNHKLLTPELLLKDDSLVKVDNGQNYLKLTTGEYIWISEKESGSPAEIPVEDLPVKDSSSLQPVEIPNGTNKQFWVTVKIPDTAYPGIYSGKIELRTASMATPALQLNLEVLPIELSEPYLEYSMYYRGILQPNWPNGSISMYYKSEQQLTAELENLFNHGVTNPSCYQEPYTMEYLTRVLAMRNEIGMGGKPLYWLGFWPWGYPEASEIEQVMAAAQTYGVPEVYFYGLDEPTWEELEAERESFEAIHAAGGKVFSANYREPPFDFEVAGDLIDLFNDCHEPSAEEAAKWHSVGHKIFNYANPHTGEERPETYRRNSGLLLWQRDQDGEMNYAYQHHEGNIWNDFESTTLRGLISAYPTIDGVVDTIEWEGWREGVDDIRYLTTLLEVIEEAKAEGKDTSSVDDWLADLKSSNLETKDLDNVRSEMIGHILYFLGEETPSDTMPPVISSTAVSDITSSSATISWFTDEPATTQVVYGPTEDLGLSTDLDTSLVANHSVILTDLARSTTYHYKAKSRDTAGNLATSSNHIFTTEAGLPPNNPPNTPSAPSPANHATGVSTDVGLSWVGGDPDAGDTASYDVYLGTGASPALVSNGQTGTSYDPGTLSYDTRYYWKVVATDNHGAVTEGDVWDFTAGSAPPSTDSMWAESITFTPTGSELQIKVKVVNSEPVRGARIRLNLKQDGRTIYNGYGSTNSAGEASYRWRRATGGDYLATVTYLRHSQYAWDESQGVTSASYTLGSESPSTDTIWAEGITFSPTGSELQIKVKVVNPEPVRGARVRLNLKQDGRTIWNSYGTTNSAGEASYRWRRATGAEYLATITYLRHSQYIWDESQGVTSASYTLGSTQAVEETCDIVCETATSETTNSV